MLISLAIQDTVFRIEKKRTSLTYKFSNIVKNFTRRVSTLYTINLRFGLLDFLIYKN